MGHQSGGNPKLRVKITAVLALWMQTRYDSSGGNPKLRVNIDLHTNLYLCAKNWLNQRKCSMLKIKGLENNPGWNLKGHIKFFAKYVKIQVS
jgi:hypothetical protein